MLGFLSLTGFWHGKRQRTWGDLATTAPGVENWWGFFPFSDRSFLGGSACNETKPEARTPPALIGRRRQNTSPEKIKALFNINLFMIAFNLALLIYVHSALRTKKDGPTGFMVGDHQRGACKSGRTLFGILRLNAAGPYHKPADGTGADLEVCQIYRYHT